MAACSAVYSDDYGDESTSISNDGKELRMTIRGVTFIGTSFDGFEPENKNEALQRSFSVRNGELCDFELEFAIPIEITGSDQGDVEDLHVKIVVGRRGQFGVAERSDVSLKLTVFDGEIKSRGTSQWFEDELLDIQRHLPTGRSLRCCFGCAYSDYSVYGHGFFGNMLCFRNIKDRYSSINDKDEYMEIMDLYIETVQETYVCPEFEIRRPNTGYRG